MNMETRQTVLHYRYSVTLLGRLKTCKPVNLFSLYSRHSITYAHSGHEPPGSKRVVFSLAHYRPCQGFRNIVLAPFGM